MSIINYRLSENLYKKRTDEVNKESTHTWNAPNN